MARIVTIGQPANESERKVIAYLRDKLPDSYTIYPNIELVNQKGQPYEYDIIIHGPQSVVVVEVKDYKGIIKGNAFQWIFENDFIIKSPFPLLNQKTKVVADRISNYSAMLDRVFVNSIILIVDPKTKININDEQTSRIKKLNELPDYFGYFSGHNDREYSTIERKFIDQAIATQFKALQRKERISDYTILETVSKNDLYTTYLAKHELLSVPERYFLKVYTFDIYATPEQRSKQRELVLRDANVLNSIQPHKNIVRAYQPINWESDKLVLPYEWIDGMTLRVAIQEKIKTSTEEKLNIIKQIAMGLQYLHDNNITHRNLKPENIFLLRNGTVKIGNLDLAKWEDDSMMTIATAAGRYVDERYTAPEVWVNPRRASKRSDVFSLGVIIYEYLTNKLPYLQIKDLLATGTMPDLEDVVGPNYDKDLTELLKHMCFINPEKRIESASEVIEFLELIQPKKIA